MPYRFKLEETFSEGVRRILLSQIDMAEKRLSKVGNQAEAVHDARKCFKRSRALLRLVRQGIGEAAFRRENAALRDIAAQLSNVRDRHVALQTLAKLEATGDAGITDAASTMRAALQSEANGSALGRKRTDHAAAVLAALRAVRKRVGKVRFAAQSFAPIERGLRRSHKRIRDAMHQALKSNKDAAFHDWRKGVQQHWRHMQLLSRAWPAYFEARITTAKELSQMLGDDHDLSMLAALADDRARSGLSAAQSRRIVAACRSLQAGIRHQAVARGLRLNAEKPRSLARHVRLLWIVAADSTDAKAPQRKSKPGPRSRAKR